MLSCLFNKVFKGKNYGTFYLSPVLNCVLCYMFLTIQSMENPSENYVAIGLIVIFTLLAIGRTLKRFISTLQKPYHKENLHIVLSSIFAVITFFAAIYSVIFTLISGSFHGLDIGSHLDRTINVIYYSIITFTMVGYGDIYPIASIAKIVVSIETMAFFIFFVILTTNRRTFFKSKDDSNKVDSNM